MLVAQKTLCGKDNIFHKIFCAHFVTSTFVSSVGRAWDCSEKFALTSQGLRFNPGTEDFTYLTFRLNVYLSLHTASAHI